MYSQNNGSQAQLIWSARCNLPLATIAAADNRTELMPPANNIKLIIDVTGSRLAGKTTLLNALAAKLSEQGYRTITLDENKIRSSLAAGGNEVTDQDVCAEMIIATENLLSSAEYDIVFREGASILPGLNNFKDSIITQHEQRGIKHAMLHVTCSNGMAQWNRGDTTKMPMFTYLNEVRDAELKRDDGAINNFADMFGQYIEKLDLDTKAKSGLDKDRDQKIQELVQQALTFLEPMLNNLESKDQCVQHLGTLRI